MRKYFDSLANPIDGRPIQGASVFVLNADGSQATIYRDANAATPITQPLLTDATGYYEFYIFSGTYTLQLTSGSSTKTIPNVDMTDATGGSVTSPAIISALGYTPYSASNPAGYLATVTGSMINTALGGGGALLKSGGTLTGPLIAAADPSDPLGVATKQFVQSIANGQVPKGACVAATTGNITLSTPQTIDGIAVTTSDRVLVKNQSSAAQNGIYVVAGGSWTRATDMDVWSEVPGASTFVTGGTVNANTGWVCTSPVGGVINTDPITFTQSSAPGSYSATGGLTKTGSQFSLTTIAQGRVLGTLAAGGTAVPSALAVADIQGFTSANASGQAFTGDTGVSKSSGTAISYVDSVGGASKQLQWRSGGLNRWSAVSNATPEGGSNAGSDFELRRYNDAGNSATVALSINRATGLAGFELVGVGPAPNANLDFGVVTRTDTLLAAVRGSAVSPYTLDGYYQPLAYLEMHSAGRLNYYQAEDSNKLLAPTFMVQTFAEAGATNALTGMHSRVVSATAAGTAPTAAVSVPAGRPGITTTQFDINASINCLCAYVGTVRLAAPSGQNNRSAWGANFDVWWDSGNNPINLVGVEIDIINTGGGASGALPGFTDNFTGFWAQTAPRNVSLVTPKPATAAFLATDAGLAGMGWQYGACLVSHFYSYGLYINNALNQAGASGIYCNLVRSGADANLMLLTVNSSINFGVSAESGNPVLVRVAGTLQRMTMKALNTIAPGDNVFVPV